MEKIVYIVHAVDTEGPLYESTKATFERLNSTFGITLPASHENLVKLRNKEIPLGGIEDEVSKFLDPALQNYNDTWDKIMAEDERKTKESYEDAIRRGELSYTDYSDYRFASNSGVTKEISTGKVINCLDEVYNLTTRKKEYRKWYVTEAALKEHGKYAYKNTAKGDYGIVITKEEYWKLGGKCAFNMAHTPTDRIVWEKLYGIGGAHE